MNKYQRITLIVGAVVLCLALLTTPKVILYPGGGYMAAPRGNDHAVMNTTSAIVRIIGVTGVTALVFFALKGTEEELSKILKKDRGRKKEIETDDNGKEGEREEK